MQRLLLADTWVNTISNPATYRDLGQARCIGLQLPHDCRGSVTYCSVESASPFMKLEDRPCYCSFSLGTCVPRTAASRGHVQFLV